MTQALRFLLPLLLLAAVSAPAQDRRAPRAAYTPPKLDPPAIDLTKVTMLESEMRDYAENLVAVACEDVLAPHVGASGTLDPVPPEKWDKARKLMGVAMSLAPRSRHVVVANARLKENRMPAPSRNRLAADAFCSLMLARSKVLLDTGTPDNVRLASYLLELSTIVDPENEDAIYQLEIFRMDGNKIDWTPLLGGGE